MPTSFYRKPYRRPRKIGALEKVILMTHEQRLQMGQESREKMSREFNEEIIIDKYLQAIAQCYQKN